jgi:hypothetical protein
MKLKLGLNNNQLKIIAIISMLVDHVGEELFPDVYVLRVIGRFAFPIFAYMIAEGCKYTRNRAKYLGQIAALGIVCQLVYFFAMGSLYQGILITFSLSIVTIFAIDLFIKKKNAPSCILMVFTVASVIFISVVMPIIFKKQGFALDYGALGVLMPIAVYYLPKNAQKIGASALILLVRALLYGDYRWFALLAIPLLCIYNGERGKAKLKYLFYIFYPTHLVVIYLIGLLIR